MPKSRTETSLSLLLPLHRICATRMFSKWPPGILFIFNTVLKLAPSLLSVLIVHQLIPLSLSSYVWTTAYILAFPITFFTKSSLQWIWENRELRKLGGCRMPQVSSLWPGGIDLLRKVEQSHSGGYLCENPVCITLRFYIMPSDDFWDDFSREYGPTFHVRMVFQDLVQTFKSTFGTLLIYPQGFHLGARYDQGAIRVYIQCCFVAYMHRQCLLQSLITSRKVTSSDGESIPHFEKTIVQIIYRWMQSVLGTGVFNSDGEMWK